MLDEILVQLSIYLEKAASLQRKVKSAMIYPIAVLAVSVIVVAVLLIFVIPVFENIFQGFGATLPAPTLMLIYFSHALNDYWWLIIGVSILIY